MRCADLKRHKYREPKASVFSISLGGKFSDAYGIAECPLALLALITFKNFPRLYFGRDKSSSEAC